jgi:hypothetical protein
MLGIETIAAVDESGAADAAVAHDTRRLSRWFLYSPWASSLVHETSIGGDGDGGGGDGGGTAPMKFSAMGVLDDLARRYPLDSHLWQDPAVVGANDHRLRQCSDEPYISFVGYLLCLCAHLRAVQLHNIPGFSWRELLHLVRHDRIPCVASASSAAHRPRSDGTAGRLQRLHLQYDDATLTAAMLTVPPPPSTTTATTATTTAAAASASSLTADDLLQALCTDWTAHFPSCLAAIPSLRHIQVTAHPVFQCEQAVAVAVAVAVEETTTTDNDDNGGNRDAAPSSVLAPLVSRIAAVHRNDSAVPELDRQLFGERTIVLGPLYPEIDPQKGAAVDTPSVP